ncbi:cation diffusion facilitator family transporter [Methanoregula sp.]|uniref:cation diffusion facilitator family transporter n=1 Tax=Methanoregula sp. TaxID=2052170 RepID=UPI002B99482F|nr:cation diffusion facilitator family transporter [Methanoregula sp.]HVP97205.1 cation diffusion facilitator family transporter [Methanoregula sp.]
MNGNNTQAEADRLKVQTAHLSVISNAGLVILKFVVGFAIGSVSIISEAIHSSMDLLAAVIAFFSVKKSAEPPDAVHAFGHGKFEDVSGLVEALLIVIAAVIIIVEAVLRLASGQVQEFEPGLLAFGIAVMGISVLANWYVSSRLMKVAKQTESIALESDAWHLRTDIYTSLGVFAGLIIIHFTGYWMLDPLIAIAVAIVILHAAAGLLKRSFADLIDQSLPGPDEERIKAIICAHAGQYAGYHGFRSRRSGPDIFIEFHLVMPGEISVTRSHDLADHLEADLLVEYPRAKVTIHIEPCGEGCTQCDSACTCTNRE